MKSPVTIGIGQFALMGATAFVCWVLYTNGHPAWASFAAVLGALLTVER